MTRGSFMTTFIAACSMFTIPFASFATRKENNRNQKPFKVDAGKDRFDKAITLFEGDTFFAKVSIKDTDGDLYIYESSRVKRMDLLCIFITGRMNIGMYWKENF